MTNNELKELFFRMKRPTDFGGRADDETVEACVRMMQATLAEHRKIVLKEAADGVRAFQKLIDIDDRHSEKLLKHSYNIAIEHAANAILALGEEK